MLAKLSEPVGAGAVPTLRKTLYSSQTAEDATCRGAFSVTHRLELCLCVPVRLGITSVTLRLCRDGCPDGDIHLDIANNEFGIDRYTVTLQLSELCAGERSGLFYYEFIFNRGREVMYSDTVNNVDMTLSGVPARRFLLLVYEDGFSVPDWLGSNIIYHIFVDRFGNTGDSLLIRDGAVLHSEWDSDVPDYAEVPGGDVANNDFFGGTLDGITTRLDYLGSLGVGTLYLSPVFDSPSNHKYDTGDYESVDTMFGGDAALDRLLSATAERGMKVILDGVFNHTGDDSRYFNRYGHYPDLGAYQSVASPYFKWYNFREYPDQYECWWNIRIMPRLRHDNPDCRHYFTGDDGIGARYIRRGISGWRLDVADELNDDFLDEFRESVKRVSDGQAVIIGEVWENAADKQAYGRRRRYLQGRQLDSVMNYPVRNGIIDFILHRDGRLLYDTLTGIYASYPPAVCNSLMNLLGTHDTERILTVLADAGTDMMSNSQLASYRLPPDKRDLARQRLILASTIQYTIYGTPSLYYGDEAGMEGGRDPFCRMPFPWGREDMQLLGHYRRLGLIRREAVYSGGDFRVLEYGNGYFAFERTKNGERIITAVNCSDIPHCFTTMTQKYKDLLSNADYRENVMLGAMQAAVLKEISDV